MPNSAFTFIVQSGIPKEPLSGSQRCAINQHISLASHEQKRSHGRGPLLHKVKGGAVDSHEASHLYAGPNQRLGRTRLRDITRNVRTKLKRVPNALLRHLDEEEQEDDDSIISQPAISPWRVRDNGLRQDPFSSLPVGGNRDSVLSAIDYYAVMTSMTFETLSVSLNTPVNLMEWHLRLMTQNGDTLHSVVALLHGQLCRHRGEDPFLSPTLSWHRHQAMTLLQQKLQSGEDNPSNATIATILALTGLDMLLYGSSTNNRRGLALAVSRRGGLDKLGDRGYLKGLLLQLDYFWTLEGMPTMFPFYKNAKMVTPAVHSITPEIEKLTRSIPAGFVPLSLAGMIGEDVLKIIDRINRAVSSTTRLSTTDTPKDGEVSNIFDVCPCLHTSDDGAPRLEVIICLTAILFTFNVHQGKSRMPAVSHYRASRKRIMNLLPRYRASSEAEWHCSIWAWVVVLDCWQEHGILSEEGRTWAEVGLDLVKPPKDHRALEAILRTYLWHEALGQKWLEASDYAQRLQRSKHDAFVLSCCSLRLTDAARTQELRMVLAPSDDAEKEQFEEGTDVDLQALKFSTVGSVEEETQEALPPMLTMERYIDSLSE